ncbi:hypothetical protein [Bacillus phage CP-51]|uniref:Uncharacterized protein n=1 Tax=Bacillus phage CP-51 TaxID=1391188 RepID=A0A068EMU2_9CAUD|nr:hypothetical protein OZ73_gp110 [Bacillus phage CP-51]AID50545.1 hypothetical protein [Bacillus phage CP-51]
MYRSTGLTFFKDSEKIRMWSRDTPSIKER